ncbi:oxidoreductase [Ruixingdingia sedimenti]|uniref:Oxidoreductase n=1 Tax=Ruixingdingia sedimenti TaxID=3073604 RepID=A0ABU1F3B9_9RHOB|nr:oxidoreductase [Xinfangfangia sp. LG-4]MDR5651143.1 oxidoreductase [Xinfangfangia sp. LG-4]
MMQPAPSHPCAPGRRRVLGLGLGLAAGLTAAPLRALAPDAESPLLTVSGLIGPEDAEGVEITFDDAMLAALPQVGFTTATIWTSGPHHYSGPSLLSVLALAGARGKRVTAVAANAYRSTLAIDALEDTAPIITRRIDGQPFGLRERGPLWIMFPFDEAPRFRTERHFAQCVWQLTGLIVGGG